MDNYPNPIEPGYIKNKEQSKKDKERSLWTLSYRLKGLAAGFFLAAVYSYIYEDGYPPKILVAGAILGYFLGWVIGRWFYTEKS